MTHVRPARATTRTRRVVATTWALALAAGGGSLAAVTTAALAILTVSATVGHGRAGEAPLQAAVDRRFNRHRVDAQRAIDAFGHQLRDEVDLGAVHGRLLAAVDATVQPAGVGVWLRRAP